MTEIGCTLDGGAEAMSKRITEWRTVIARGTGPEPADGGVTLTFPHDQELAAELARLSSAEFACCSFFTFNLTVGPRGMRFTATAPPEARVLVTELFGDAAHG